MPEQLARHVCSQSRTPRAARGVSRPASTPYPLALAAAGAGMTGRAGRKVVVVLWPARRDTVHGITVQGILGCRQDKPRTRHEALGEGLITCYAFVHYEQQTSFQMGTEQLDRSDHNRCERSP